MEVVNLFVMVEKVFAFVEECTQVIKSLELRNYQVGSILRCSFLS